MSDTPIPPGEGERKEGHSSLLSDILKAAQKKTPLAAAIN